MESSLFDLFKFAWKTVESSDADLKLQEKDLSAQIENLNQATALANSASIFSKNECLDDVATANIRYLLIPALLANLHEKFPNIDDRLHNLKCSEVLYLNYLAVLQTLGVEGIDTTIVKELLKPTQEFYGIPALSLLEKNRENFLKFSDDHDIIKSKLNDMSPLSIIDTATNLDEDHIRNHAILTLQHWGHVAVNEIRSIRRELPMLDHRAKLIATTGDSRLKPQNKPKSGPLKILHIPKLATRDDMLKKVFGLGYPSGPTISIEEDFERMVAVGEIPSNKKPEPPQKNECPDEKEANELKKQREWDDWKDNHRTGYGNMLNMG